MKKIVFIIIICFLVAKTANSQISYGKIEKTKWFCENKDSLFFKSDTLKLIKYKNVLDKGENYINYVESEYYDDTVSIKLEFKKRRTLIFTKQNYHKGSKSLKNWDLKKSRLLINEQDGQILLSLKVASFRKIKYDYKDRTYCTEELILVKM